MGDFSQTNFVSKKIKVKNFITFCSNVDNRFVLYDEYKAIDGRAIYSKIHDIRNYETKNRYNNILPYAHNRVKLEPNEYCESDYINATHIKGFNQKKHYIATQHPLSNTVYDFWHMILHNKCRTIVMLTQLCTGTCYQYYPDYWNVQLKFNDITIFNIKQTNFDTYRRRILLVSRRGESQLVMHYHLLSWANPNSFEKPTDFTEFIQSIRHECDATHPILVLSSSGNGRTGVYIALDILIDQARHKNYANVFQIVANLCKERNRMISCVEQYLLIYEILDTLILHTVSDKR